eukprot:977771_1
MMDYIDIIMGLIVVLTGVLVLSPILLYALYRFHQIRRVSIMKFRNLTLIYVINILVLFTLIIERTYVCSVSIWNMTNVARWTPKVFDALCVWLIYFLFAIKTWLLYFERKHHISLINLSWKKLINQYTKSWHISARHKYGNYKYLLKIGTIPYLTYIIIEFICTFYLESTNYSTLIRVISTFINWILTAFPLLFCCVIYYKFRAKQLHDVHHISNEIIYECILIAICLIANTLVITFCTRYKYTQSGANSDRIEALLTLISNNIFLFGIALLNTSYPLFLHRRQLQQSKLSHHIKHNPSHGSPNMRNIGSLNQFVKMLANIDGFKHFILHLLHEYSTENLVFLVELIQIKYAFQQRNNHVLLVPKQPIYNTNDMETWHPSDPSFNVVLHSNSRSSSPDVPKSHPTNVTPDILETAETLAVQHKKHQGQCTASSTIPSDTEEIDYEDDHRYQVLDFNAVEAMNNPFKERSPSPPPPMDESMIRARAGTESVNQSPPTQSVNHSPRLPVHELPSTTFMSRARSMSLSRTFSRKRKEAQIFSYLLNNTGSIFMKIELAPGLPMSAVLDGPLKTNHFGIQMDYLYNKFIKSGSYMEMNISYDLKAPLVQIFETDKSHLKQPKESFLFTVFDEVAHSILELMLDSYHRFIVTDEYKELDLQFVDGADGLNTPRDETVSTLEKEEKTTPCTHTVNSTPKTPSDDNEMSCEYNIIRNASSFNKLVMLYETR